MQRILIVDDDFRSRSMLLRLLQDPDFAVVQAINSSEAIRELERSQPQLIVLDWRLNDGVDGPGFMRELRRRDASVPVIMMSSQRCNERDEAAAFRYGAQFFFEKNEIHANGGAFLRHVKALMLVGAVSAEGPIYELEGLRLSPMQGRLSIEGRDVALNPKELALLQALLRRAGVVHPAETLWSSVWGEVPVGDWHHTLDSRVSSLRRKLGRKWGARLVSRKGQGYLLERA